MATKTAASTGVRASRFIFLSFSFESSPGRSRLVFLHRWMWWEIPHQSFSGLAESYYERLTVALAFVLTLRHWETGKFPNLSYYCPARIFGVISPTWST